MSDSIHSVRFPGETEKYRSARNKLLEAELDLRNRIAEIAAVRKQLPMGGKIKEDYVFEEIVDGAARQTRLSELFEDGKPSLIVYSFMYGPEMEQACPMCTSFIDGMDRYALHVTQRVNMAVVAKSPIQRIQDWAKTRDWNRIRLLSSSGNTYNSDYHGETPDGGQIPNLNVFTKTRDGIFHFYATEVLFSPVDGQPRHVDLLWPLWSYFDLTPEGRGTDWYPQLEYAGTAGSPKS